MITTANSVKLNGHNSPGQNLTAPPWLAQLVSTWEVVTGSEWLQIMYHNITLRKMFSEAKCESHMRREEGGVRGRQWGKEPEDRRYIEGKGGDTLRWHTATRAAFWQLVKTLSLSAAIAGKWTVIKSKVMLSLCDSCWQVTTVYPHFNLETSPS